MKLRIGPTGRFKIMQLTDIHYQDGNDVDEKSVELIRRLIREETPDLIVITGDIVYGSHNLEHVAPAFAPVSKSGIPWTFLFGNHDTEYGAPAEQLHPLICKQDGCLASHDPSSGAGMGNHVLDIENAQGKLQLRLILLDSGSYCSLFPGKEYDYVKPEQIRWYRSMIREMKGICPSARALTFLHIPLCEYETAWEKGNPQGAKNEEICCSLLNSGLFTAMLEEGGTAGVFAGHDHINDFYGDLYGIRLGYGRATGYNTYSKEGYLHGARLFEIGEEDDGRILTWERLEDGRKICHDRCEF
ncbi:MAG: metallophosphoesterase family protein [Lachnospiraceae bacterium]|nr:metallophosphoesterase family protein [Lachnospiraceae bacterium]